MDNKLGQNRSIILSLLQQNGPISRADLADRMSVNPSTVTRIISELLSEGVVQESGLAGSRGGRKAILISMTPSIAHVVGISVESHYVTGIVANVAGEILERYTASITSTSKEGILTHVSDVTKCLLSSASDRKIDISGIGISMHGLVDAANGIVLFPPAFGWKDYPLAKYMEDKFKLPVKMDNNARAMGLGECWFGGARGIENLAALKVGRGIGMGLILHGQVYRGLANSAGEVGHTTVALDGPLCDCGNYGCLEAMASTRALVRNARRRLKEGVPSRLLSLVDGQLEKITPTHVAIAANSGDSLALQLFEDMGRYLAIAIANVTNLFNPTKILIGGDILECIEFVLPTVQLIVGKRCMEIPARQLTIEPVHLGQDAVTIGAATLILQELFNAGLHNRGEVLSK